MNLPLIIYCLLPSILQIACCYLPSDLSSLLFSLTLSFDLFFHISYPLLLRSPRTLSHILCSSCLFLSSTPFAPPPSSLVPLLSSSSSFPIVSLHFFFTLHSLLSHYPTKPNPNPTLRLAVISNCPTKYHHLAFNLIVYQL